MILKDKVVLITGASSGIGEASAIEFAKEGCKVVVNYHSKETGAKAVVDKIIETGGRAVSIKADVSDPKQVKNLFDATIKEFGSVDILINNAGITTEPDFLEAKLEDWQEVFNTDLFGAMLCCQMAAKIMLRQGGGKILNTSSIYGSSPGRFGLMAYSGAKAALNNFTKNLAKMLAPQITVNAVSPGYVLTPAWDSATEEMKKTNIERVPLKRWIAPEEIADAVVFLAKNDAMTGEIIVVDAGRTINHYQ